MQQRETRFESLYREHATQVLGYLRRRTDRDDARDVAAEVFAVVWRRLDDVPDPALPWLLGVARRQLANDRRGRRRRDALLLRVARQPPEPSDGVGPARVVDVLSTMAELSADDRELLTLIGWDELTPAEAATVLDITPEAVRSRLHRARRRLEDLLYAEEPKR